MHVSKSSPDIEAVPNKLPNLLLSGPNNSVQIIIKMVLRPLQGNLRLVFIYNSLILDRASNLKTCRLGLNYQSKGARQRVGYWCAATLRFNFLQRQKKLVLDKIWTKDVVYTLQFLRAMLRVASAAVI